MQNNNDQPSPNFNNMQAGEDNRAYFKSLPSGYRFEPTDAELIEDYLVKKIRNQALPINMMAEVKLYDDDPGSLAGCHKLVRAKEWYFFTRRVKKYPKGSRPKRAAGDGYWKPTGTDVAIPKRNPQGYRKSLDYYRGKHPNGRKTYWKMHEFRLHDASNSKGSDPDRSVLSNWVLCKVYKKREKGNMATVDRDVEANPSLTTVDLQPEYQNGFISQNGAAVNGATEPKLLHSDRITLDLPPNGAGSSNLQQSYCHGSTSTDTTSNDMWNNYSYEGQTLDNGWEHAGNNMDLASIKDMTHMTALKGAGSLNPQQYYFPGSTSTNTTSNGMSNNYSYHEGQPLNDGWEYAGNYMDLATMQDMTHMAALKGAGSSNPQQYYFPGSTSTNTTSNDMSNNYSYHEGQPLNDGWEYAGNYMDLATMQDMTHMAALKGAGSSNPQQYYFHGSTSTNTTSNDMSNNYSYHEGQPLNDGWEYAGNNMDLATMQDMTHMAALKGAGSSNPQQYYFQGSTSTNATSNDLSNNYSYHEEQPLNNGWGYAGNNMAMATMKEMTLMAAPNGAGSSNPQQYCFLGSTSTNTTSNDMSNYYSYEGQPVNYGWGHAGNNMDLATMDDMTRMADPNASMPFSTMGTKPEMENHATLDGIPGSSDPSMFQSVSEVDGWLRTPENES